MIKAHKYLTEIDNYKPGKAKIAGLSKKITKLSSNENALKASPKAAAAYKNHVDEIFRYADGSCVDLRQALAKKHKIDAEKIVCGAGSDEVLVLLTSAFAGIDDEIIYSKHGFLMYPISAKKVGAKAIAVAEKNLKCDVDGILKAISPKTKIIFIANPNNPTGSYLSEDELRRLIKNAPKNILIVLDCAYHEFAEHLPDYVDAIKLVDENENVVATRTFSKAYGLASVRLGWCYSSLEIAEILNKIRGPFNVSGPAQAAGIAALEDEDFLEKSQEHNKKWLEIFFNEVAKYSNIKAWPSVANFILFDFLSEKNCAKANEIFLQEGFILREMSAYHLPSCLRATIGTDLENEELLKILQKIDQNV